MRVGAHLPVGLVVVLPSSRSTNFSSPFTRPFFGSGFFATGSSASPPPIPLSGRFGASRVSANRLSLSLWLPLHIGGELSEALGEGDSRPTPLSSVLSGPLTVLGGASGCVSSPLGRLVAWTVRGHFGCGATPGDRGFSSFSMRVRADEMISSAFSARPQTYNTQHNPTVNRVPREPLNYKSPTTSAASDFHFCLLTYQTVCHSCWFQTAVLLARAFGSA